jgi:hypothetical protein
LQIGGTTDLLLQIFCFCSRQITIVNALKIEDRLEGATKFRPWKARIFLLLEENDLKGYVEGVVTSPTNS